MFAQCPCGRKIPVNRDHGSAMVQCPNCRQTHAVVFSPRVAVGRAEIGNEFPKLELLGACVMWAVALVAIIGVLFVPQL